MSRILLTLVRPDPTYPSVCVSTHEDVDIYQFMKAITAFALALGYDSDVYLRGLRQEVAEMEGSSAVRGQSNGLA